MHGLVMKHLGWVPEGYEFHGNGVWNAQGHWAGKTPPELLATYEDVIAQLNTHEISVVHASIDKPALHEKYNGRYDTNAYRLALQFMLEKLDQLRAGDPLRVLVADEAKQEQVRAIEMVADMQKWAGGEVPGRKLRTIIDSMHFVQSCHSPGVQLADMVAFIKHRGRLPSQGHPDADAAVARMLDVIASHTPTYRMPWPG